MRSGEWLSYFFQTCLSSFFRESSVISRTNHSRVSTTISFSRVRKKRQRLRRNPVLPTECAFKCQSRLFIFSFRVHETSHLRDTISKGGLLLRLLFLSHLSFSPRTRLLVAPISLAYVIHRTQRTIFTRSSLYFTGDNSVDNLSSL